MRSSAGLTGLLGHYKSTTPCAVKRRVFLVGANPTQQQSSTQLVAAKAGYGGNDRDGSTLVTERQANPTYYIYF